MSDPLQILSFNVVSVYQKLHSGRSNGGEASSIAKDDCHWQESVL